MPPGYHPIKKNASKVPAYSTTRVPGWKRQFAATQRRADALQHRTGPVYEDGSFRVGRAQTFDAETQRVRPTSFGKKGRSGDPVLNFLHSAAKATVRGDVVDWMKDDWKNTYKIAKATYDKLNSATGWELHQVKENITPKRGKQGKPVALSKLPRNQLMVEPPGIGRMVAVGQSAMDIIEPLTTTLGRIRPGGGVHVVHGPDMGYLGDKGWATRFPWIVNKKTGEVYVGKIGDSHRDVLARVLNTTDRRVLGEKLHPNTGDYHGGFLSGRGDVGNLEMEWGAFSGNQPPANTEPSRRLLEMMFGKSHGSPYKEEHFWHPEVRGTKQGVTQQGADDFLNTLRDEEYWTRQVEQVKTKRMKHGYGNRKKRTYNGLH